ncbi:putative entry exclusion protein TrbK-alt [Caulobacter hibisci]|uniref:Entry exclusion protein TrbK-alt n=1 Tax=Caulobacter hibisci TaxID=2035993 RepID=A0ABS0T5T6_9CAUL|nr:putative entry exclusion protein TrbK-alt [Caulobacter hibisci]MBI1687044.1 putative entry exclusion protein TrbK-alt [Caulobacter hibisci]
MRWAIGLAAASWILIGVLVVAVRGRHEPLAPSAAVAVAERDDQLGRCRDLGEAAKEDVACRQAWAAARARFFGERQP